MPLANQCLTGWRTNRISFPPYRVELVGPYKFPQVTGANGVVGLSGPDGAVFQASIEHANALCKLANACQLGKAQ